MDIIATQNITQYNIVSTPIFNEFVVESSQDVVNYPIEVAQLGAQGVQGEKGDSIDIIFNEVPTGVLNGMNAAFTSLFNFVSGTVQVFLNGSLQKIVDDYQVVGNNTITLNFSPMANENILINYVKQK